MSYVGFPTYHIPYTTFHIEICFSEFLRNTKKRDSVTSGGESRVGIRRRA